MLGNNTFLKVITVLGIAIAFTGCNRNINNYNDLEILQARQFVADYEKRLSTARETALLCITSGGKPFDCNEVAFKQQMIPLYWNGTTYELGSSVIDEVAGYKRIAFIKTSYELKQLRKDQND